MLRKSRAAAFRMAIRLLSDTRSTRGVPSKNRRFSRSLKNALRGLLFIFINERNFRIECGFALLAILAGILLGISSIEWAIISTNIFFVLALEAKNTAIEMITNIAAKEYDYGAKAAKDSSSGAVLLASTSSLFTSLFIFGPRIFSYVQGIVSK
ncbi:hypothetical protein MASR2M78_17900 [Treponema sp.]